MNLHHSKAMRYLTYVFILFLVTLAWLGILPLFVLAVYAISSIITYLCYAWDKQAAQQNQRRTPEHNLHLWSFFGGWPGAVFAQYQLRHKTQKQDFQLIFWLSVILNVVFVSYLFLIEPYF